LSHPDIVWLFHRLRHTSAFNNELYPAQEKAIEQHEELAGENEDETSEESINS